MLSSYTRRRFVIYLFLAPALGDGFSLAVVNRFSPAIISLFQKIYACPIGSQRLL
jgi:hypothetical protein